MAADPASQSEVPPRPRADSGQAGTPPASVPARQSSALPATPPSRPVEQAEAYSAGDTGGRSPAPSDTKTGTEPYVAWRASEYILHDKSLSWFVVLGALTAVAAGIAVYFGQWIFAVLIVVMSVALGVYARRPPREIAYAISGKGVDVDGKLFPFSQFRAFGVLQDGALYSVQLRPAKRLMPSISIFFREEDGERIFDALAAYLPAEEVQQDPIDRLMRWLRF